jgi:hypothetical protein
VAIAQARAVLADVLRATTGWREAARARVLNDVEIERMTRAFEHDQAELVRSLA